MQLHRAAPSCWARQPQQVFALLKRSLQRNEKSCKKNENREHSLARRAFKSFSPTTRPGSPALQQDNKMTSAPPASQQTAEQLQNQQLFLAKVSVACMWR